MSANIDTVEFENLIEAWWHADTTIRIAITRKALIDYIQAWAAGPAASEDAPELKHLRTRVADLERAIESAIESDRIEAHAATSAVGQFVPHGYVAASRDGHETYFKGDAATSAFHGEKWRGLMEVIPLYRRAATSGEKPA